MGHPNVLLIVVMLVAGLVGGGLNYFRSQTEDAPSADPRQSLLGGVIASFLVPLFLNMISSNLLDAIKGTANTAGDVSKLFVFAGFCLLAAVSSRSFIATLTDRVLKEAKATRQEVKQIKSEVEPIIDKETEKEPQEISPLTVSVADNISTNDDVRKVLNALANSRFTLRTRTGIVQETHIDQVEVDRILATLVETGLAGRAEIMVHGKPKTRWYINEKGRIFLAS